MKKYRKAKIFLEELRKVPIVSVACEAVGLSRMTVYRWRKEDAEFRSAMDQAEKSGNNSINDLANSRLIKHVQNGEPWAIKFWLMNRDRKFIYPRTKEIVNALMEQENAIRGFKVIIHNPKTYTDIESNRLL